MPAGAWANDLTTLMSNNYGTPGNLIDMPTAEMAPDGQIGTTVSHFDGFTKTTFTFQITPWMSGSFRYSGTKGLSPVFDIYYDRSFDVRVRLLKERDYLPAVVVGLQDFLGTGVLSGEYVAATKSLGPRVRVTGGIGWGRLGSYNSFGGIGTRPKFQFAGVGTGGTVNFKDFFNGPMALFGGISYQVTDKITVSAEYSSDAYEFEKQQGVFKSSTPFNFGLNYQVNEGTSLRLFALHGEEFGGSITLALNPHNPPVRGGLENAPFPVGVRDPGAAADLGWTLDPRQTAKSAADTISFLDKEGLDVEGFQVTERTAHILLRNDQYNAQSEALGRTMRVLTRTLPASIETITVTLVRNGIPTGTITFNRTDLERLENAPAAEALAAGQFTDSLRFGDLPPNLPGVYPRFEWTHGPYLRQSFFDPDNPWRADLRYRAKAEYLLGNGWVASGALSIKIVGNLDESKRPSNSKIPRVRSTVSQYSRESGPTIEWLTLSKYARLAPDFYGRLTVGYLEWMYAGASGEILWKPVNSRLALGAEINYVRRRATDQLFELRTNRTVSGVIPDWNGHVSAYYDFGNGFNTTVHAGRYLAGDWGATLEVNRTFANGWSVGAFATKTDVSAADFGEGSFDKGIRFTMPFSWLLGKPTQQSAGTTIRPLTRDGGQRVDVRGRLYGTVTSSHQSDIAKSWGKFWR